MTNLREFLAVAIGMALLLAPARALAEPKVLAGVAYEEVVRGETANGEAMPVLIAFHYSGGSAAESFENYDQIAGPVRILVPLGRYPKRQGLSYFPVDYYQRAPDEQFRVARDTVDGLAPFLEAVIDTWGAAPVVSGISQGGDISLLLAVYHPELVAAAFPFAAVVPGGLSVTAERAALPGPPIHAMQGEADTIVDVEVTRARIDALAPSLPVSLTTYPGLGHDISPAMKADYTRLIEEALRRSRPEIPSP